MIKKTIIIPIYNCQVDVVVTDKVEEVAKQAGFNEECTGYEGLTLSYPSNPSIYCIILRKSAIDACVIAHECYHLTSKIMRACDVRYDAGNIEPFAYLHGYLVEELHKIVGHGKKRSKV